MGNAEERLLASLAILRTASRREGGSDGGGNMAMDPTGQFLYVPNQFSNNVSAFILKRTGALTSVCGSPVAAGAGPVSVATTAGP
ncbi:MAG: hypothetical protein HYR55_08185 [Acidobacteria bacterium]|nr:hypothetical protein [Acidobacteriota bacterium]MBI3656563.1 hypothetical protein [Acidobacteriota bacterium]